MAPKASPMFSMNWIICSLGHWLYYQIGQVRKKGGHGNREISMMRFGLRETSATLKTGEAMETKAHNDRQTKVLGNNFWAN